MTIAADIAIVECFNKVDVNERLIAADITVVECSNKVDVNE